MRRARAADRARNSEYPFFAATSGVPVLYLPSRPLVCSLAAALRGLGVQRLPALRNCKSDPIAVSGVPSRAHRRWCGAALSTCAVAAHASELPSSADVLGIRDRGATRARRLVGRLARGAAHCPVPSVRHDPDIEPIQRSSGTLQRALRHAKHAVRSVGGARTRSLRTAATTDTRVPGSRASRSGNATHD